MESKIKLKIFVSLIWNSKNRHESFDFFQFFIRKIKTLQLNHSNKESLKCSWLLKNHHMDAISICQFATSRLIQKLVLKIISENFTFNKSRGFSVRKISALSLSSQCSATPRAKRVRTRHAHAEHACCACACTVFEKCCFARQHACARVCTRCFWK